jgi:hypothetical protein
MRKLGAIYTVGAVGDEAFAVWCFACCLRCAAAVSSAIRS